MSDYNDNVETFFYKGEITVELSKPKGMITLKGDLDRSPINSGVIKALGLPMPKVRTISRKDGVQISWMAPDELLILVDFKKVEEYMELLEKNLKGEHYLLANVSDARAIFNLKGKGVREVLSKGTPVNMEIMKIDDARRSRLGQLPVAFWMLKNTEIELICFRSVAEFMFNWLKVASAPNSLPRYIE